MSPAEGTRTFHLDKRHILRGQSGECWVTSVPLADFTTLLHPSLCAERLQLEGIISMGSPALPSLWDQKQLAVSALSHPSLPAAFPPPSTSLSFRLRGGRRRSSFLVPEHCAVLAVSLHHAHTFADGSIITCLNYPNSSVPSGSC